MPASSQLSCCRYTKKACAHWKIFPKRLRILQWADILWEGVEPKKKNHSKNFEPKLRNCEAAVAIWRKRPPKRLPTPRLVVVISRNFLAPVFQNFATMENRRNGQGLAVRGRRPLSDLTSQHSNRQTTNVSTFGGLKQVKIFFISTLWWSVNDLPRSAPFEMLFLATHSGSFVLIIHQKGSWRVKSSLAFDHRFICVLISRNFFAKSFWDWKHPNEASAACFERRQTCFKKWRGRKVSKPRKA